MTLLSFHRTAVASVALIASVAMQSQIRGGACGSPKGRPHTAVTWHLATSIQLHIWYTTGRHIDGSLTWPQTWCQLSFAHCPCFFARDLRTLSLRFSHHGC